MDLIKCQAGRMKETFCGGVVDKFPVSRKEAGSERSESSKPARRRQARLIFAV
jgi:hypothetical protein